jgi:hypothetical protein
MVVVVVIGAARGTLSLSRRGARRPELADALEGLLPSAVHHVKKLAGGAHVGAAAALRAYGRSYLIGHGPIMLSFLPFLIVQSGNESVERKVPARGVSLSIKD